MLKNIKSFLKGIKVVLKNNPSILFFKVVLPILSVFLVHLAGSPLFALILASVMIALNGIFESFVVSSNKLYKEMTGYTPQELMTATIEQAVSKVKSGLESPFKSKVESKKVNKKGEKKNKSVINLAETLNDNKLQ